MKKKTVSYQKVIIEQLEKEAAVRAMWNKLQVTLKDDSPLDVSNVTEVLLLMGLPSEKELPEGKSWDEFIDDYTAVVWGEKQAKDVVLAWEKKIKKWKLTPYAYEAKNHKTIIKEHIKKQQDLFQAIKSLGAVNSTSSPLGRLVSDYNFLEALMGPSVDGRVNDLFSLLEKQGDAQVFLNKWL